MVQGDERMRVRQFQRPAQYFSIADKVGDLVVFNIGGNKYRLVASLHFNRGKVYIRHVLTHQEYDRRGPQGSLRSLRGGCLLPAERGRHRSDPGARTLSESGAADRRAWRRGSSEGGRSRYLVRIIPRT